MKIILVGLVVLLAGVAGGTEGAQGAASRWKSQKVNSGTQPEPSQEAHPPLIEHIKIRGKSEIVLRDKDGKETKRLGVGPYGNPVISPDRKYVAYHDHPRNEEFSDEEAYELANKKSSIVVLDQNGNELFRRPDSPFAGVRPVFGNNGRIMFIDLADGKVEVRTATGELVVAKKPFSNMKLREFLSDGEGTSVNIAATDDLRTVAIVREGGVFELVSEFVAVDSSGQVLFRISDIHLGPDVFVSPDGDYICIETGRSRFGDISLYVRLYSREGRFLWERKISDRGTFSARFDSSGRVIVTYQEVRVVRDPNGKYVDREIRPHDFTFDISTGQLNSKIIGQWRKAR